MDRLKDYQEWYKSEKERIWSDFFTYLRFPSISSEESHLGDIRQCAQYLVSKFSSMGLDTKLHETSHHPYILAEKSCGDPSRPTLLLYNHYDVQPVDPLELWESDPFEPREKDGRIYARGASDNKGQGFYTFTAVEAFLALQKSLNFNLKLIVEGGEEVGSPGFANALEKNREAIQADYLLVIDSNIDSLQDPSITLGMRGVMTFDLSCKTANGDLHSGWGGIAPNSVKTLVSVLSQAYDRDGKVLIPGFYDGVVPTTNEEKELFFSNDYQREELKKTFGIEAFSSEKGYSLRESGSARPAFEINGIGGGYQGDGFKTVIPAIAHAKISFRTVPNQNMDHLEEAFRAFLKEKMPDGAFWELKSHGHGAYFKADIHSPIVQIARDAYSSVFGKTCTSCLIGGSVPITGDLCRLSGAEAVAIGAAVNDNQFHAPNEFFYVDSFEKGFLTIVAILEKLNGLSHQD